MKTRNIILSALAAAALIAAPAQAQKTASQVRIYLNAGHGSWGPNDRPMATIPYPKLASTGRPDTCGFYESNTNLWKILKLGKTLEKMGVKKSNIMYSRKANGPYPYVDGAADEAKYNRSLSEISAEVEANNMDMFISIHSNAAAEASTTNYPLILYRGNDGDGGDLAKGSRDMSKAVWGPHYMDEIDPQSSYSRTNMLLRGDLNFYHKDAPVVNRYSHITYHGYLGVLKHGVPGFLLEGFFHTYQPARHRALNKDYCAQEGVRVARGVCDYFKLTPETTGYIMGTIKDLHEKMNNSLYTYAPGSDDQWVPINGAKVYLKKDGETVQTYTVDNNYNGVFVFEDLEPGRYTLDAEAAGYKPLDDAYSGPITVKANATSYAKLYLENEKYVTPVAENYPTPDQPEYLSVPEEFRTARTSYSFFSQIRGTVKRWVVYGDSAVALAINKDKPTLHLIDLKSNTYKGTLSLDGIVEKDTSNLGDIETLNDIAFTADGKLIGINCVVNQYSESQVDSGYKRGTLRVYKWAKLDADPMLWVSTESSANFYRATMGKALAVSGEAKDCTLAITATTMSSSKGMRMLLLSVVNNKIAGTLYTEKTITDGNFSEQKQGEEFSLNVSPLSDKRFVIDGTAALPEEFEPATTPGTDSEITGTLSATDVGEEVRGANYFKYGGRVLMVTPYANSTRVGGLHLYDVTDGLQNAKPVGLSATTSYLTLAKQYVSSYGKVSGEDLTLYLFQTNKYTRFTTVGVTQPAVARITASGLAAKPADDGQNYTFQFTANVAPTAAEIQLLDAETGETKGTVPVSAPTKGANTVTVPLESLPITGDEKLHWAVKLTGSRVNTIRRLNSSETATYTKAFCAVDNVPDSPGFGNIYLVNNAGDGNSANALFTYKPDYTRSSSNPSFGGQELTFPYRLSVGDDGRLYVADFGNTTSGVFVASPSSSATLTPFFEGTRNSKGLITNDGASVGSSTPSAFVAGGKMFVYLQDFSNKIGVYDIGTGSSAATSWGKAPSNLYDVSAIELNGNGSVVAGPDGGVWVSQIRYLGNNTMTVPSLVYVDAAGNVVFNSGSSDFVDKLDGSNGGGMAVSRDGTMLAINDGSGKVQIFTLAWQGGKPTLTPKYSFTADVRAEADRNSIYQMAFDYAGNLVCSGVKLGVYSIPTDTNVTVVPAPKTSEIVSGVASPIVDKAQAVSYDAASRTLSAPAASRIAVYDTAGALVASSQGAELQLSGVAPGVYIVKVDGQEAKKIIVK